MTITIPIIDIAAAALKAGATAAATTTDSVPISGVAAGIDDNSNKVIIIWQKSSISDACKNALATIEGGVHIYDPLIDTTLDAPAFSKSTQNCLVLWAGNPTTKTAASDVHTWYTANRAYIKQTQFQVYVIPTKFFSLLGLESVYTDCATAIKALPKWSSNLHKLLLQYEAKFPTSEYSVIEAIFNKVKSLVTK